MATNDYGPSITACRLWEKVSAKGNSYLTGRLGGLRVTILPNFNPTAEDDSTHHLIFGEAPKRQTDGTTRPPLINGSARDVTPSNAPRLPLEEPPDDRFGDQQSPPARSAPRSGTGYTRQDRPAYTGPKQQIADDEIPF